MYFPVQEMAHFIPRGSYPQVKLLLKRNANIKNTLMDAA